MENILSKINKSVLEGWFAWMPDARNSSLIWLTVISRPSTVAATCPLGASLLSQAMSNSEPASRVLTFRIWFPFYEQIYAAEAVGEANSGRGRFHKINWRTVPIWYTPL